MTSRSRGARSKLEQKQARRKANPDDRSVRLIALVKAHWQVISIIVTLLVTLLGGMYAVVVHVDNRMQGHASLITTTLASQISEVKSDVRHLDTNTRTSDRELRQDIKTVRDDVHNVRSDVQSVSSDVESLAQDVGLLTKGLEAVSDQRALDASVPNGQTVSALDLE